MMQSNQALESGSAQVMTPCVLIVDDDPQTLQALERVFEGEPYEVYRTSDPWLALEWIKAREVHLLITDEFMPGMLGTDLLEAVRVHSPATATILLTGYPKPSVAYRGFQQRMDLLMPKPWENEALRTAALRLLREHSPRAVFLAPGSQD